MEKIKYCSRCKNSEKKVHADYLVQGKIWTKDGEHMVPYKGYICKDHFNDMIKGNNEIKILDWVNDSRDSHALKLIRGYTSYGSVKDFVSNFPTVRKRVFGSNWLRSYYKEKNRKLSI